MYQFRVTLNFVYQNSRQLCIFIQREGERLSCTGGLYIGSLWLLMLISVVLGAVDVLEWLDSLYIISYVTFVTTVVKYIPLVR